MKDSLCDVEVGSHSDPYWRDKNSNLVVCTIHKNTYKAREDEFGPFDWETIEPRNIFANPDDPNDRCLSRRPNGWGGVSHCEFKKGHDGPHSWVPY